MGEGNGNGLDINDFALVIQTLLQTDCLDATHATNRYDFKLISVASSG